MQQVLNAAAFLAQAYRDIEPRLRSALARRGIIIRNYCPSVVNGQPYDVSLGIQPMIQRVTSERTLYVSGEFSEGTVYPAPADNHWFRHVHDMVHLLCEGGFDVEGETEVHSWLWQFIQTTPGYWGLTDDECEWVWAVYYADTYGQTEFFDGCGDFPAFQRQFVIKKAQEIYHAPA